ncbi:glycosyltransferase [Dokdonella sp.]|uniref:glycosyltransferase n=1 Tax=Dokdonella sp. TaxID=2291710 RepID=UPI00352850E1
MTSDNRSRPTLLVLASTYPRWAGDHEPGFVHELGKRLTDQFHVIAIVPSAPGAETNEVLDGVEVIRYRYAPRRLETLVHNGGMVANLRRQRWKMLLLPTFLIAQAWNSWRQVRKRQVDVIHAHWLLPQGFVAAILAKLSKRFPPFLVTSHGADLFALRGRIMTVLKLFVARNADGLTVVSAAMCRELERIGIGVRNVSVQPMGVDLSSRFSPDPEVKRSRDEILFVGRLVEKKGLKHLIDAMPAILMEYPSCYLTVAGFGPELAERNIQVRRLGLTHKVRFVGSVPQPELPALYRRAAVFVAPFVEASGGDQEGLGLVAVEAAGCGCPVVVGDLPATRSAFGEDQVKFCTSDSPRSIAEQVCAILKSPPNSHLAEAAFKSLLARFDWPTVAAGYEKVLLDLIRKPS